jgi:hypothetical protein
MPSSVGNEATLRGTSAYRSVPLVRSTALTGLCVLIAVLAAVAAGAGLFYDTSGSSYEATSVRGETVELHGRGLYHYDSIMKAAAHRGTDVLTLAIGIPLLVGAVAFHRRGSLRGTLVLMGTLVYFLYVYASLSLGAAYNHLFLLYVALFGGSLVAFTLTFTSIDPRHLARRMSSSIPRRGPAIFMIFSGVVTFAVWLMDPLAALLADETPELLEASTTLVTHALDIAIIVPAALAAGVLILRGSAMGYMIAISLLVLEIMLAPMIALQTVFQLSAGITLTTAEIIGPIGGFVTIALIAVWVLAVILGNVEGRPVET